ncbi:MAG: hypothetical protein F6J92_32035 [Symploca sp. SIO1A3]|nr:hypothetical protein [Symploca sp. SIO2C1]NER51220.1 hypothetical protein [Symploca sp. SIO1A3]
MYLTTRLTGIAILLIILSLLGRKIVNYQVQLNIPNNISVNQKIVPEKSSSSSELAQNLDYQPPDKGAPAISRGGGGR